LESTLRTLLQLEHVEVDTNEGRATVRVFRSENRFDVVRASVLWTASGDRWGRVARDGSEYTAHLYERIAREAVPA
jgi:hypothetical protein